MLNDLRSLAASKVEQGERASESMNIIDLWDEIETTLNGIAGPWKAKEALSPVSANLLAILGLMQDRRILASPEKLDQLLLELVGQIANLNTCECAVLGVMLAMMMDDLDDDNQFHVVDLMKQVCVELKASWPMRLLAIEPRTRGLVAAEIEYSMGRWVNAGMEKEMEALREEILRAG